MTMRIRFQFERDTKGALRYAEVDDDGKLIEQAWATVGSLYIRKSSLKRGDPFPRELNVPIVPAGLVEPVVA
jgi:hypothetical protein